MQTDSLHYQCAHTVSCFFNMRPFLIHLLLFVLRSEHDNLQSIGVVKYFIFEAGCRLFELREQKVKLLLYYLFLGKQFVKGILTDKNKKEEHTAVFVDGDCAGALFYFILLQN